MPVSTYPENATLLRISRLGRLLKIGNQLFDLRLGGSVAHLHNFAPRRIFVGNDSECDVRVLGNSLMQLGGQLFRRDRGSVWPRPESQAAILADAHFQRRGFGRALFL